ncbi:hypothetical protein [Bradyrhizobium betae]|uniref:Uncharacterized protein n=1 Tax=Bradyrhizobium betae TaxID=244734 RepID=A0A5P6PB78_9BRAD|nr:hypothetical protein [Bradyrhizobium betae]MCS3726473.1 hypothetical protein [Bradyrhizobium betae]QFI75525.1 hypothetical protein F8237_25900 [Bradyrhizobium betae]
MAYVFRRGWSKAYRRLRPPVVVSGAIQITLNAAIGSFVAATIPATFSGSLALGAGAFDLAGNAAAANTRAIGGPAILAFTGMTAAFNVAEAVAPGSFAVAGIGSRNVLNTVAAPGAFILPGLASSGSVALSAEPMVLAVAGTASNYERDFEAWVRRPFDAVTWQPDVTNSSSEWSGRNPSVRAWMETAAAASTWTAAAVHSEPWTNE